jgi:hypothetical protein
MRIAHHEPSGYAAGSAISRDNPDHSAASHKLERAVCDGVFNDGVLRPELFGARSIESGELLQSTDRAG